MIEVLTREIDEAKKCLEASINDASVFESLVAENQVYLSSRVRFQLKLKHSACMTSCVADLLPFFSCFQLTNCYALYLATNSTME